MLASERGYTTIVEALLQHNANVEVKDQVSKEGTEEWTMAWVQTTPLSSCLCFIIVSNTIELVVPPSLPTAG